jgi:3-phosphoshikimate 1-carboxyvinyltransferase
MTSGGDILPEQMVAYPKTIRLGPVGRVNVSLEVPGSKSLTNRALILAALADGRSVLDKALVAEDSQVMIKALRALGFPIEVEGCRFAVEGSGGHVPVGEAELDLRLSGTSIRFLTALVALGKGNYRLDGNERMRQRPIQDLLDALAGLGVKSETQFQTGAPPVIVRAAGIKGGKTRIAGDRSSQYLSALLMVAPLAEAPVTIEVIGDLQSKPFIDMTIGLMEDFGVAVEHKGYDFFKVCPSCYQPRCYPIEGDAMAAGYFWAAAAASGGRVEIRNLGSGSLQGDRRITEILDQMGCQVTWRDHGCEVIGPRNGHLIGGQFDLNDMPDQAQTVAVLALFADSPVTITNVANMRIKETDRLAALSTELSRLGARVEEGTDSIVVHPLSTLPRCTVIDTYDDHRMAMAFAVAGLRFDLELENPSCVAKTYPRFFEDWATLHPSTV